MPVPDRRTPIAAVDVLTALGENLDETWSALLEGRTAVAAVRGFDASGFGEPCAAQVWDEPAEPEENPERRILGRHGQLLDVVLKRVHAENGVAATPRSRVGLYVLTGLSDTPIGDLAPAVLGARDGDGTFDLARLFRGSFRRIHPLWPLSTLQNVAIGQVSIDLDIRGDNVVYSSEGDGAVRTMTNAAWSLADDAADRVLVGGGSDAVSAVHLARMRLRGDLGQGPAAPGAADGDGCSPGEAAGALLLGGGDTVLARIGGGATTFELAPGRPGPTEDAFRRAMEGALEAAGIGARDLDAVFLHAEGHAGQDAAEARALAGLIDDLPLVATKGALGHTRGAAPVIDTVLAVRAMATGTLPPTVTRGPLIAELRGRLADSPVTGEFRRILVSAAGSHGGAGALVVEAAP